MKQEYQDIISTELGVKPILINSSLVSAQNRERLYWMNWKISLPKDKGILLKDIVFKDVYPVVSHNLYGGFKEKSLLPVVLLHSPFFLPPTGLSITL